MIEVLETVESNLHLVLCTYGPLTAVEAHWLLHAGADCCPNYVLRIATLSRVSRGLRALVARREALCVVDREHVARFRLRRAAS